MEFAAPETRRSAPQMEIDAPQTPPCCAKILVQSKYVRTFGKWM